MAIAPTGGMAPQIAEPHLSLPSRTRSPRTWCAAAMQAPVVAIHARRPDDGATCNADIYREHHTRIRAAGCDIVINNSTGGGARRHGARELQGGRWEIAWEERISGMDAGAEMCTCWMRPR